LNALWSIGRPRRGHEQGQALVIFALSIVFLLGMAGVAIDAGRFVTQRRFLQNAADAAALAAANTVVQQSSATVATVEQAARDNLAINLAGSAAGAPIVVVPMTPGYGGLPASGPNLVSGIVLTDDAGAPLLPSDSADKITDIRVALRGPVDFTLGRVMGMNQATIDARAQVTFSFNSGNLMPIAVRRYINLSGPYAPGACADPPSGSKFADLAATQSTSCQGAADPNSLGYGGRTPASPAQPGPTITLIGQGAQSSNSANFRSFINLDIRNFDDLNSRVYYNSVPVGANSNTMKQFESAWVRQGYPGPDFPPITNPPNPDDQVAIMDGNTSGQVISDLAARWNVGDRFLAALYDGTVMSIPDFSITGPTGIGLAPNTTTANAGKISIQPNKMFDGNVIVATTSAPAWLTTSYSPGTAFMPSQPQGSTVTLSTTIGAATPQVDMLWVKGHSAIPYLTDHYAPIVVNVGGVTKDLSIAVSPDLSPAAWGDQVTYTATVTVGGASDFPAGVTLSLEPVGSVDPSSPVAFPDLTSGSYWFGGVQGALTSTISTWSGTGNSRTGTATFTINTGQLGAQKTYDFVLTAIGVNSSGQPIRHQIGGHVLSQGTSDNSNYIDITGFAAYRITAMDANSVTGQAISGVYSTASDPALRAVLTPRLGPW
jgi:hypothetical protein